MNTTVLIVNWNTRELLLACLASLAARAPMAPVVVVDNASADGSAEAVRERFPGVTLVEAGANLGFARGNNLGLREVRTPYVWLLNPDTEIRAGALEALEAELEAQPRAAVAGSALFNPDGSPQDCAFRFPTPWSTAVSWLLLPGPLARARDRWLAITPTREAGPVDWVLGASMLVRGSAIAEVGPLDEGYFVYSEELDWCWRFGQAGWQTRLAPASEVVHHGGAATGQVSQAMLVELFRTRTRFFGKHLPWTRRWYFPALMALAAAWNALYATLRPVPGLKPATAWAIARTVAGISPSPQA